MTFAHEAYRMTATAIATTATELILVIDLGKYKRVACLYRNADTRFHAFPTTREEVERLRASVWSTSLPKSLVEISGGRA
jgi:hypothetical protein